MLKEESFVMKFREECIPAVPYTLSAFQNAEDRSTENEFCSLLCMGLKRCFFEGRIQIARFKAKCSRIYLMYEVRNFVYYVPRNEGLSGVYKSQWQNVGGCNGLSMACLHGGEEKCNQNCEGMFLEKGYLGDREMGRRNALLVDLA
jgi:hypothetical protein